jgi:peptidoglycan-N-acetylglucosamine deacetylase
MKIRLLALFLVLLVSITYAAWRVAGAVTFQLFGDLVDRVSVTEPLVALTFDDGPTPKGADSILAILKREDVRATFFFTGSELEANSGLANRFVQAGHELGNHSYSHQRMVLKSSSFIRAEIERTDSLIRIAGHSGSIHFRPPYGKKLIGLPWYLSRTGRTTIMWDVDPDSDANVAATSEGIVAHVFENVRPGSIVLLHVMYPSRATSLGAVAGIIQGLRARGYRFVTVSELIESQCEGAKVRECESGR